MKVTLGGDRIGSGNKQKVDLKTYNRSSHNLSEKFASPMQCGVLIPFLVKPVMRGDTFTMDCTAGARTIPTLGPLFGSYKMQMDYYFCADRLYQAILHNNPLAIGLKMSQVKLPKLRVFTRAKVNDKDCGKFSESCLLKYLGMSGLGRFQVQEESNVARDILAIPALAYYDIFKTYYANKQEENAYYITTDKVVSKPNFYLGSVSVVNMTQDEHEYNLVSKQSTPLFYGNDEVEFELDGENLGINKDKIYVLLSRVDDTAGALGVTKYTLNEFMQSGMVEVAQDTNNYITFHTTSTINPDIYKYSITFEWTNKNTEYKDSIVLNSFKLSNIDDMRMRILSDHQLGHTFLITKNEPLQPYATLCQQLDANGEQDGLTKNSMPFNGLVVKTYQSDLFNNWINTDWIDGDNGISEITKIAVTDGAITIDSINMSEKLYNMLNRIAVSGGTYDDWQDVVYTENMKRAVESPIYLGGMSNEIVFEEIIQSAPTEGAPLGTLGGRGTLMKRKGGHVNAKIDEAGFIIGIVSITPRIYQTQGNEFYMTELDSLDDMHKPALDGIGFQNLIGERMAWFDTKLNANGEIISRTAVGKVPAWMEYMTSVDKAYGDFADITKQGFMILNRHYDQKNNGDVKDFTTYIDPTKYNYAFAYTALDSQNFWVNIETKITARRLMSAKQIPNI